MDITISELQRLKTRIHPNIANKVCSRPGVDKEIVKAFLEASKKETIGETCDRLDIEQDEGQWSETTVTAIKDALLHSVLAESYLNNFMSGNGNLFAYARLERGVRRI